MKKMLFDAVSALALNAILDLNGSAASLMHTLLPVAGFTSPQYLLILGVTFWLYFTVGRQQLLLMMLLAEEGDPLFDDYANRRLLPMRQKIALYVVLGIQVLFWPLTQLVSFFGQMHAAAR